MSMQFQLQNLDWTMVCLPDRHPVIHPSTHTHGGQLIKNIQDKIFYTETTNSIEVTTTQDIWVMPSDAAYQGSV
jgi:hypothetical protein